MDNTQQKLRRSRDGDALAQACEREGCPICLVTLERMERAMDHWQYEVATEVENCDLLVYSKGFCSRHTWQLAQMPEIPAPFALAIVYRSILPDLLEDVERDLARIKPGKTADRVPFWHKLWPRKQNRSEQAIDPPFVQHCPFCHRQAEIERELLQELLVALSNAEFQAKLGAATGLCLTHFTRSIHMAENDRQRAVLLAGQRASLQRNMAELEELVRKHDYRFLHEPRGSEMTAWRRAAQLLAGNRGIR